MKFISSIVLTSVIGNLGAQVPVALEAELEELCENVALQRPLRPLDIDALLTCPSEALRALEKVVGDPRARVREYGTRIVIELGSRTTNRRQSITIPAQCSWMSS